MFWRSTHSKSFWLGALGCGAAALAFLLLYEWIVYKVPVTDIYLPASSWSDEVVYSKQLSAVVQYGAPQGYFGFNESHAEIGTFAAWGPALFWIYALPGFFLRGENAFIWCNLFFVVAGWLVFARAVRLSAARQALFAVVLACLNAPLRYIFSAMQEPFHYALVLAITGTAFLVRKNGRRPAWAALCILCAAATLVRPYNAVLWLYPLALAWPRRRALAGCLAGAAVSTAGTLVLMSRFYAPYFFTNVDTEPLRLLAHLQVLSAAKYVFYKLSGALGQVWQEIAGAVSGQGGGYYLVFLLLLAVTLGCLIWDARHKRSFFWKGCAVSAAVVIFAALMLMYRTAEASRHTLVLDVLLLASLVLESPRPAAGTTAAIAALSAAGILALTANGGFGMPSYREDIAAEVNALQTALIQSQQAVDSADPWDHTIAYSFGDNAHVGMLYAAPDGMGLQFDEASYLLDTEHTIHARYMMTGSGSAVEQRLLAEGWTLLYQGTYCTVYERS